MVLEKDWFDFNVTGESVNLKSEEIKRVILGEEPCSKDSSEGNPQFRRSKENKCHADESVVFLQVRRMHQTRMFGNRKANADIFRWPKKEEPCCERCGHVLFE